MITMKEKYNTLKKEHENICRDKKQLVFNASLQNELKKE